jgi:hypothetical protein
LGEVVVETAPRLGEADTQLSIKQSSSNLLHCNTSNNNITSKMVMLNSAIDTSMVTSGGVIGAASTVLSLWLIALHKNLLVSLSSTRKVTGYGVYTDFGEALRTHFWYLLRAKLPGYKEQPRPSLEQEVKDIFLAQFLEKDVLQVKALEDSEKQVLVTHSCRSIFYYLIRTLLEESKEKTGKMKIKMALPAVHFGSFYRLLKSMEASMNCVIEFYEVDLKEGDWTLDSDSIDENEIKSCDLIVSILLYRCLLKVWIYIQFEFSLSFNSSCVNTFSGSLFRKTGYLNWERNSIFLFWKIVFSLEVFTENTRVMLDLTLSCTAEASTKRHNLSVLVLATFEILVLEIIITRNVNHIMNHFLWILGGRAGGIVPIK